MNNYWLSRAGGEPEGPFAETQIVAMWYSGHFAATDQLCMEGAEDWRPASVILIPPKDAGSLVEVPQSDGMVQPSEPVEWEEPEPVIAVRGKGGASWLTGFVIVGLVVSALLVIFVVWAMATGPSDSTTRMSAAMDSAKQWARSSHPGLTVSGISEEYEIRGTHYRAAELQDASGNKSKYALQMEGDKVISGLLEKP